MKKNVIIAAVLILAVAITVVLVQQTKKPKPPEVAKTNDNEPQVIKEDAAAILKALPQDLPIEEGLTATDSYKYIPAQSKEQQSTLEYISKKSFTENVKVFKDYLASKKYNISNKTEQPNLAFFYGTKDNNDLLIKIENKDNQVNVSISYLKR